MDPFLFSKDAEYSAPRLPPSPTQQLPDSPNSFTRIVNHKLKNVRYREKKYSFKQISVKPKQTVAKAKASENSFKYMLGPQKSFHPTFANRAASIWKGQKTAHEKWHDKLKEGRPKKPSVSEFDFTASDSSGASDVSSVASLRGEAIIPPDLSPEPKLPVRARRRPVLDDQLSRITSGDVSAHPSPAKDQSRLRIFSSETDNTEATEVSQSSSVLNPHVITNSMVLPKTLSSSSPLHRSMLQRITSSEIDQSGGIRTLDIERVQRESGLITGQVSHPRFQPAMDSPIAPPSPSASPPHVDIMVTSADDESIPQFVLSPPVVRKTPAGVALPLSFSGSTNDEGLLDSPSSVGTPLSVTSQFSAASNGSNASKASSTSRVSRSSRTSRARATRSPVGNMPFSLSTRDQVASSSVLRRKMSIASSAGGDKMSSIGSEAPSVFLASPNIVDFARRRQSVALPSPSLLSPNDLESVQVAPTSSGTKVVKVTRSRSFSLAGPMMQGMEHFNDSASEEKDVNGLIAIRRSSITSQAKSTQIKLKPLLTDLNFSDVAPNLDPSLSTVRHGWEDAVTEIGRDAVLANMKLRILEDHEGISSAPIKSQSDMVHALSRERNRMKMILSKSWGRLQSTWQKETKLNNRQLVKHVIDESMYRHYKDRNEQLVEAGYIEAPSTFQWVEQPPVVDENYSLTDTESPFHDAAARGDMPYLMELIRVHGKIWHFEGLNCTEDEYLIKGAGMVHVRNVFGETPLYHATLHGQFAMAQHLIEGFRADVMVRNKLGSHLIHAAAISGNAELLSYIVGMMSSTVPVCVGDQEGSAPLHLAAERGHAAACSLLLELGADVNATDMDDMTPLLCACLNLAPTSAVVQLLLEKGANPFVVDLYGFNAIHKVVHLHTQSRYDSSDPFGELQEDDMAGDGYQNGGEGDDASVSRGRKGSSSSVNRVRFSFNAGDGREGGEDEIHDVQSGGSEEDVLISQNIYSSDAVSKLLMLSSAGLDVNERSHNADGWTPLHIAAMTDSELALRALVELGADVTALSSRGMSSTAMATSHSGRSFLFATAQEMWDKRETDARNDYQQRPTKQRREFGRELRRKRNDYFRRVSEDAKRLDMMARSSDRNMAMGDNAIANGYEMGSSNPLPSIRLHKGLLSAKLQPSVTDDMSETESLFYTESDEGDFDATADKEEEQDHSCDKPSRIQPNNRVMSLPSALVKPL